MIKKVTKKVNIKINIKKTKALVIAEKNKIHNIKPNERKIV